MATLIATFADTGDTANVTIDDVERTAGPTAPKSPRGTSTIRNM
jgi:hypothetical protein